MVKKLRSTPFESFERSDYTKLGHVNGEKATKYKSLESNHAGSVAAVRAVYDARDELFKDVKTSKLQDKRQNIWELNRCDIEYYPEDASKDQTEDSWLNSFERSYHFVCIKREENGGILDSWVFRTQP